MSYNDDAVLAKLSALNETQESIVTVAQWVMFHRRHADRTGQLWLQRLKDSGSNKRLNLIYLANEVAQQSKARRKDDFLIAFSPVIAEATATAYKGATAEVQNKLRRVVEVWRQRQIFEVPIQEAIEARIDELDKSRSSTSKRTTGSIFSSNSSAIPKDLEPLLAPQQTITKLVLSTRTSLNAANQDYTKLTDTNTAPPTAPVQAARLNGLLKTLANAEGAVLESIKARQVLVEGLEKILDGNREALRNEEAQLKMLGERKAEIDRKKNEVEETIMRGFGSTTPQDSPAGIGGSPGSIQQSPGNGLEVDRPEIEALTPPGYPMPPVSEPVPEFELAGIGKAQAPGSDLLSSLSTGYAGSPMNPAVNTGNGSAKVLNGIGSAKKRKLGHGFDDEPIPGLDDDGLDPDVAEMLRSGQ